MKESEFQKARRIAYRLLKYSLRTENELDRRLQQQKIKSSVIKEVITSLKKSGLVDDSKFAQAWAAEKFRKGYGPARIEKDFAAKGIDSRFLSQALALFEQEEAEVVINNLIKRKVGKFRGEDSDKIKNKVSFFLQGRGFTPEQIDKYIQTLVL